VSAAYHISITLQFKTASRWPAVSSTQLAQIRLLV